jgi:hypothetical protein
MSSFVTKKQAEEMERRFPKPNGVSGTITFHFTFEEMNAVLTPNQIKAVMRGIAHLAKRRGKEFRRV